MKRVRGSEGVQQTISLENFALLDILGVNNQRFVRIQERFPDLRLVSRGSELLVEGVPHRVAELERLIFALEAVYMRWQTIEEDEFNRLLLGGTSAEAVRSTTSVSATGGSGVIVYGSSGVRVSPRTAQQRVLVEAERDNDVLFAVGPAGTGKTYIAIALAVRALRARSIRRIILTRPAVEAGERLGFLPGDLKDKLDPYLQPLYDALNDMMPAATLQSLLHEGTIQISPLAYMRGRTLDNAYVILDEAQNATIPQIKMFLTRLGRNAKAIVTGDLTQIDLPRPHQSGLTATLEIVRRIPGVAVVEMRVEDIVRHRLVSEIVEAFRVWEASQRQEREEINEEEEMPHSNKEA